jgi:serine/threonine protein kinase
MDVYVGDLSSELVHSHISPQQKVRIYKTLFTAVKDMNQFGLLHLDLALRNILVDENKNIFLADFGFATSVNEEFVYSNGTLNYCAPELLQPILVPMGQAKMADVYSAGIIIYSVAIGSHPYSVKGYSDDYPLLGYKLRNEMIKVPTITNNRDLDTIVRLMTATDFKKRAQNLPEAELAINLLK